jgi:hypothetical protein
MVGSFPGPSLRYVNLPCAGDSDAVREDAVGVYGKHLLWGAGVDLAISSLSPDLPREWSSRPALR